MYFENAMNDWDSVHRGNYYSTRIVLNAHCKVNGISIHLVATSSGLNFLEKGKQVIEIDSSSFLGGNGNRLGPMGYCMAGISSCFLATFATIAASQGVRLTRLNANVECGINFAKTFDVADEPITEGITVRINAEW